MGLLNSPTIKISSKHEKKSNDIKIYPQHKTATIELKKELQSPQIITQMNDMVTNRSIHL